VQLIPYADLTWPEVAQLPRHLPLLIPLGRDDYDYPALARLLSAEQIVVLPPIPYGFRREDGDPSGQLHVRPGLLRRVMLGISRELRAQGFTGRSPAGGRIIFLNGHGEQGLNVTGLEMLDASYQRKVGLDFPTDLSAQVVVISTGHTEQHGHHLPLSTDSLIVDAIAQGMGASAPADVFCLPVWPYGVSTHTREFPGTLNLGGRVFEDFFLAIVDRLVELGAEMIYFSNGHGGNHSFLVNVVKYAGERHPRVFVATEWLHTTGPALERYRQSGRGGMGHGGELETSYVLHLRPELVHMDRATTETEFIRSPDYYMDWVEGGKLIANPPWSDDTASGLYGDGTLGTAEKGRLWLAAAVEEKLDILREIHEQHARRQMKRSMREEKRC
jgi:creatinine amidohydrolase